MLQHVLWLNFKSQICILAFRSFSGKCIQNVFQENIVPEADKHFKDKGTIEMFGEIYSFTIQRTLNVHQVYTVIFLSVSDT